MGTGELAIIDPYEGGGIVPAGWLEAFQARLAETNDFQVVNEGRATIAGHLQRYRKLGRDITELKKAERCAEIRLGELMPSYYERKEPGAAKGFGSLPNAAKYEFSRMACYAEDVHRWIEEGIDTRAGLLAKITEKEGAQQPALADFDGGARYQVICADPPWRYDHTETPDVRAIENHYTTMTQEELLKLEVPAANSSVLFLWATNPKLPEALEVMAAWGFTYRTNMAWVKPQVGMGYYTRGAHELLLIGKRGNLTVPTPPTRPKSWVQSPRLEHSVKPDVFFEIIEAMYPDNSRLEMFARAKRPGWDVWGHGVVEYEAEVVA